MLFRILLWVLRLLLGKARSRSLLNIRLKHHPIPLALIFFYGQG